MKYDLRYHSSRAEIWRWYWSAWRARLWRVHVLCAAIVAFLLADAIGGAISFRTYSLCFLVALPGVTLLLASVPQLLFKNKERTLLVGPDGWSTQIGHKSASRRWSDVAAVHEAQNSVVISGTNGNALIVPLRAFADQASMQQFIRDAQAWRNGSAG